MSEYDEMALNFSGKHNKKLKSLYSPLEQTFGINYFFYLHVSHDRKMSVLASNTELVQHYFDEKMHMVYPFLLNTQDVKTGMYVYDSVPGEDFQDTLNCLEKKYQVKHTCILARQDQQGYHLYGFTVPPALKGNTSLIINEATLLKKFIFHFENEMQETILDMKDQAIDLTEFDKETSKNRAAFKLPEIYLGQSQRLNYLKKLDDFYSDNLKFTSREVDIIKLFLEGKSAREISEQIHLSSRTVEHYVEGLKDKLCAYTKSELFEALNEMKQLNIF